jgi:hypothetical protein
VHFWDRLGVEGVDIPEGRPWNRQCVLTDLGQDLLAMDVKWAPDGRCAVICGKQSFCMVYDDGPETAASMWEEVR